VARLFRRSGILWQMDALNICMTFVGNIGGCFVWLEKNSCCRTNMPICHTVHYKTDLNAIIMKPTRTHLVVRMRTKSLLLIPRASMYLAVDTYWPLWGREGGTSISYLY